MTILHIDASARTDGSVSRKLTQQIVDRLGCDVIRRDLAEALPQIDEAWLGANWTPADQRDDVARSRLALSDALVDELQRADTLVIGVPVYNFSVPAALKAWIDLVCRAGLTFQYSENGPRGLLTGKRAVLVFATGGMPIGSDFDYASGYMTQIMNFIGITDVEMVVADRLMAQQDEALASATAQIEALAA